MSRLLKKIACWLRNCQHAKLSKKLLTLLAVVSIIAIWQRGRMTNLLETKDPKDVIRAQVKLILNDEIKPKEKLV